MMEHHAAATVGVSLSACQPHFGSSLIISGSVLIRSGCPCILFILGLSVFFSFFENEFKHFGHQKAEVCMPTRHSVCFPCATFSETFLKSCFGNSKPLVRFREVCWFWLNVEKVNASSMPLYQVSTDFCRHHHLSSQLSALYSKQNQK